MTLCRVYCRYALTYYAKVVEVGLYAVVGTTAYSNLKLVGQYQIVIALIEYLVQLFGELKRIY